MMRVARLHTESGRDVCASARFRTVSGEDWQEYTVPQHWNQAAADVLLTRVFYAAPLPALTRAVEEAGVPSWLWRQAADTAGLDGVSAEWRQNRERDIRDVLHRMAGALTYRGWKNGLFSSEDDARAFYDEYRYLLLHRIAAPELAQWQSLGLDWAYGISAAPYRPAQRLEAFGLDGDAAAAGLVIEENSLMKDTMKRVRLLGERLALEETPARAGVTLPIENSDSPAFIAWKRDSDVRQVAEQMGRRTMAEALHHVMDACDRDSFFGFDPARNAALRQAMAEARSAGLPETAARMALRYAEEGYENISLGAPEEDQTAEDGIRTTVSVPDTFIEAALTGHGFLLEMNGHYPAERLWHSLGEAIWASGEPAVAFRNSLEASSPLRAVAPSMTGGFVFCAGASSSSATLHLKDFDITALRHAARLMTLSLEAAAEGKYRPILLGLTNIAAVLMGRGLAYDSEAGRATAALVTAFVSGVAAETSAEIAAEAGAFPAWPEVAKTCLQHVKDRMAALTGAAFLQKGMTRRPVQLRPALCPEAGLADAARAAWDNAYRLGKQTGFRHAHLTGIDTEPPVQALLGAQTQDILPEAALVRFESYFSDTLEGAAIYGKKMNPMVPRALAHLGYNAQQIDDIYFYAVGHGTLLDAPHVNHAALREKGFHQAALDAVEAALNTAQHVRYVFNKWTLGDDFCRRVLGFTAEQLDGGTFDMLSALGFSEEDIEAATIYCCGTLTLEGAPHLQPAHLAVFDCIAPSGSFGVRRVSAMAQIKMQAAVEPFLSGAAAHTVMLGHHVTIDDVQKLLLAGWELGVKRLKFYRDGCSLLHPVAATWGGEEHSCHSEAALAAEESSLAVVEKIPRVRSG